MFIFFPKSWGQLTGWKAVLAAIVIVGIMGASAWSHFQPKSFDHGAWDLGADQAYIYSFTVKGHTKFKAEFNPQGADAATVSYGVYLLNEANKLKLDTLGTDPDTVSKLANLQGSGVLEIPELYLEAGTYYIIAGNSGKTSLKLAYKFYEISDQ